MSFELQLKAFAEKCGKNANLATRKIVIDVGKSIVMKSPVGDAKYWVRPAPPGYVGGRFRANWQYSLNYVPISNTNAVDPSGEKVISQITADVESAGGVPAVHYITNTLPYAQRLEEGWSYRQAPNGMVGLTVVEFQTFVDDAVKGMQ